MMIKKGVDLPAPLPEGLDLEPKGNVTVIAGVPWIDIVNLRMGEVRWKTIKGNLPIYKDVGADTVVLWPIWEHAPPVESITATTSKGEVELRMGPGIHWWVAKDFLKPDPERGSEEEFLDMIREAHSLGLKVVLVFQIKCSLPGGYIYEKHPDWHLKNVYRGYAVHWPWRYAPWGYLVNTTHSDLIRYVREIILPYWINVWGVDGISVDEPAIRYCDPVVKRICENYAVHEGFECLTPVDGYYTTEPLAKAIREKIEALKMEIGSDLICMAENPDGSWLDWPKEHMRAWITGDWSEYKYEPSKFKWSTSRYWDAVYWYKFRERLIRVYNGLDLSYSENFVNSFKGLVWTYYPDPADTELAPFVNMFNDFHQFKCLHDPKVAECFITLATTAPSRLLWIGEYQLDTVSERDFLRSWYKRLIKVKKAYPALQSRNIENALLEPGVPRLIAYNRWLGNQSATVIVNAGGQRLTATVQMRFQGRGVHLIDLLHGDEIRGDPENLKVDMPPHTARVLVELNQIQGTSPNLCSEKPWS